MSAKNLGSRHNYLLMQSQFLNTESEVLLATQSSSPNSIQLLTSWQIHAAANMALPNLPEPGPGRTGAEVRSKYFMNAYLCYYPVFPLLRNI